jgi:two-component system cell cycle sensor histidine kinase/response regulator CckA
MKETLARLRLLMKATSDAVYDYDLRSKTIEWNDNLRLLGYAPDDIDPGIDWWAQRIHPEDRARTLAALDEALTPGLGNFEATYRFRCGDGRYRHVVNRSFLLREDDGTPIRMIGALQDVHIYQQMFERNPQPMWAFHRETLRFLDVNEMAIRVYGYSREEFLSMSLTDIRPPEDVPLLRAVIADTDRAHEGRSIWRHFTKSGDLLHVEVHTQDIEMNGEPARLAIITDVSRRILVEQQIRESQKLDAIGQLAGGIAHDFNNFLSVIQGLSRATLSSLDPQNPLHANLQAIDQAASRAVGLTSQLLAFADQKSVQPQLLVWSSVISNTEFLLRKLVPERIGIEFITHTTGESIQMDLSQLEQILFNLISNARDAIPAKGQIAVTSAVVEMNPAHPDHRGALMTKPYLQLTIADTGIGMSEAVLSHLFEPFFTTKPQGQGIGLGLSTVYGIVRHAGGGVRVDSEPGQGTEFRVYLPLAAEQSTSSRKYSILVVENESDLRRLIASSLTASGFNVIEAANGLEAMSTLNAASVDLMLTDIVMPEREGLELIQSVRASFPALPVIALSGAYEGRLLPLAKSFGANLTLRKPADMQDLAAHIRSLLDGL